MSGSVSLTGKRGGVFVGICWAFVGITFAIVGNNLPFMGINFAIIGRPIYFAIVGIYFAIVGGPIYFAIVSIYFAIVSISFAIVGTQWTVNSDDAHPSRLKPLSCRSSWHIFSFFLLGFLNLRPIVSR